LKKNKIRLALSLFMVFLLIFTLAGCGAEDNATDNDNDNTINGDNGAANKDENNTTENNAATENDVYITEYRSERTDEDYKTALKELVDADEAGEITYPENTLIRYPFVPLRKDGELIGHGTWVRQIIYQHAEDMLAVVAPDGSILKWYPIDANDHHPELKEEEYLKKYYGMTQETTFNPETDVISGSTISSNTFFFELRNILLTYEQYGPGKPAEEEEEAEADAEEEEAAAAEEEAEGDA